MNLPPNNWRENQNPEEDLAANLGAEESKDAKEEEEENEEGGNGFDG